MYCEKCGAKSKKEDAIFCWSCGERFSPHSEEEKDHSEEVGGTEKGAVEEEKKEPRKKSGVENKIALVAIIALLVFFAFDHYVFNDDPEGSIITEDGSRSVEEPPKENSADDGLLGGNGEEKETPSFSGNFNEEVASIKSLISCGREKLYPAEPGQGRMFSCHLSEKLPYLDEESLAVYVNEDLGGDTVSSVKLVWVNDDGGSEIRANKVKGWVGEIASRYAQSVSEKLNEAFSDKKDVSIRESDINANVVHEDNARAGLDMSVLEISFERR